MEQLYPFAKNRYFKKKRMRAVDFERDQAFADHKLSFLSHWVFGTGVAFGLGVQRIDSDSLLVEPGLAIDAQGRFLIVDEPTICRVRALPGFEALQSENALLWLSYKEELLDPMFVADDEGQNTQYAVAKERFELSLSEEGLLPMPAADEALLSETVLFEDEEIRVSQSIPRVLSATHPFHLRLYIQCFSLEPLDLELTYAPDIPGFTGGERQRASVPGAPAGTKGRDRAQPHSAPRPARPDGADHGAGNRPVRGETRDAAHRPVCLSGGVRGRARRCVRRHGGAAELTLPPGAVG